MKNKIRKTASIIATLLILLTAAAMFAACKKDENIQVNTKEDWDKAIDRTYEKLTASDANYLIALDYTFINWKCTVEGNKCKMTFDKSPEYWELTNNVFYEYNKAYKAEEFSKEAMDDYSYKTVGEAIFNEFILGYLDNLDSIQDFKDIYKHFTKSGDKFILKDSSKQEALGNPNDDNDVDLFLDITFDNGLIKYINYEIKVNNEPYTKATIAFTYGGQTVTLPNV